MLSYCHDCPDEYDCLDRGCRYQRRATPQTVSDEPVERRRPILRPRYGVSQPKP
jgi:hypothetical protein